MKRIVFLLVLSLCSLAAWAYSFSAVAPTGQTLYYSITSSTSPYTVCVTYPGSFYADWPSGYTKPTGSLTIPSTVTHSGITYSVTAIRECAFVYCGGLTSVTIPNSVTAIGDQAFYYCIGLTSVTIPNSVTAIGDSTFMLCSGLTSLVVGTTNSVYDSRNNCNAIIETATNTLIAGTKNTVIPNSVTAIGNWAFYGCSGLTSVTIPNSVTSIGVGAFAECSGLTSVTIESDTPPSTGDNVFLDAPISSATLYVPCGAVSAYSAVSPWSDFGTITEMSYTYRSDTITAYDSYTYNGTTYTESGTYNDTIANSTGCDSLVTLHLTILSHGHYLTYSISDNAATITGHSDTATANSVEAHTWPDLAIPGSITVGGTIYPVTAIGNTAFERCSSLTSVTIPNTVTAIGGLAFGFCSGLTSVTIPNSVTVIGGIAFIDCESLTSLVVGAGNPVYDSRNNCNAIIETATNTLMVGTMNTTIPNTVTAIGGAAFAYCSGLSSITIPNSVTTIGGSAFFRCSGLTSVAIGNAVTTIGNQAFYGCSELYDIYVSGNSPATLGTDVFNNVPTTVDVHVPCGSLNAYRAAWAAYFNNSNYTEEYPYTADAVSANSTMGGVVVTLHPDCSSNLMVAQAVPFDNYTFSHWQDGSTYNPRTIAVTSDTMLTAYFSVAGTPSPDTIYIHDTVTVNNYIHDTTIINNYIHDTVTVNNYIYDTVYVGDDTYHNLSVVSDNTARGLAAGNGRFPDGCAVEIAAIPIEGNRFVQWQDGNTENPRTVIVTDDMTFVATFEPRNTEGISQVGDLGYTISSERGVVTVSGAEGQRVRIFDSVGRLLKTETEVQEVHNFQMPASGAYLIQVGEHPAQKVVVVR